MRGQAMFAAALSAAALFAAQPAAAQSYYGDSYHNEHVARQQQCTQARNNGAASGAIIGGLAGAVLGSQAAARGHRTDGSIVGGIVGAVAGAAIGNSASRNNCETRPQGSYDPYYGRQQGYYEPAPYEDLEGGPYRESSYRGGRNRECRYGQIYTRDPDGYEQRESVYMCRDRNGYWRPTER